MTFQNVSALLSEADYSSERDISYNSNDHRLLSKVRCAMYELPIKSHTPHLTFEQMKINKYAFSQVYMTKDSIKLVVILWHAAITDRFGVHTVP